MYVRCEQTSPTNKEFSYELLEMQLHQAGEVGKGRDLKVWKRSSWSLSP